MDKSEMKCSQAFLVICLHPRRSIKVTLAIRLRKNRVWSVNLLQPVQEKKDHKHAVADAHLCHSVLLFSKMLNQETTGAIRTVALAAFPQPPWASEQHRAIG